MTQSELEYKIICINRQARSDVINHVLDLLSRCSFGFGLDGQTWFISHCIEDEFSKIFPRSIEYNRKLLRNLIKIIERSELEISEELYQAYTRHLTPSTSKTLPLSSGWSYAVYSYSPSLSHIHNTIQTIKSLETTIINSSPIQTQGSGREYGIIALCSSENMLGGGTGSFSWEAGFFLAEYILSNPHIVSNKHCVELGCGNGILGVALHRAGCSRYICTDGDAEVLENCTNNLKLNGALQKENCRVERVRWCDGWNSSNTNKSDEEMVDVLLGADLTYDPTNIPDLLFVIKTFLCPSFSISVSTTASPSCSVVERDIGTKERSQPTHMLLATTKRTEATFEKFLRAVEQEPWLALEDITHAARESLRNGVQFHHIPALENARERILLHKLTAVM